MLKQKIKIFLKNIKIKFFFYFYGNIKKIISAKNNNYIKITKLNFNKIFFYNIYKIKYGRIFSNTVNDTAFLSKSCLITEPSYQYRYNNKGLVVNGKIHNNSVLIEGTPSIKKNFKGTLISLLSGGAAKNNYWHWMFDTLPRISIFEKGNININKCFFLLPSLRQKFQEETLLSLGLIRNQLIDGERYNHLQSDYVLTTDHPVVIKNNPTRSILNIPIWIIDWHRKKFLKNKKNNFLTHHKIFIDRSTFKNFNNRRIINNFEVKEYLIKEGFRIIKLEDLNFIDQVFLFNNAKIIISMHGAALTNIIFCKKNTRIIEIQTRQCGDANRNLAIKCGLDYKRLIEKNLSRTLNFQNFHVNVDIKNLKKIIND